MKTVTTLQLVYCTEPLLIYADSCFKPEKIAPYGDTFTLRTLQAMVGGYVEILPLGRTHYMVVNEDGHRLELPPNQRATDLYMADGRRPPNSIIAGDVVICPKRFIDEKVREVNEQ